MRLDPAVPRRFRFLTLSLALTLTGCEAMANAFAQLLMVIIIVVSVMTALWLVLVSVNAVHLLRGDDSEVPVEVMLTPMRSEGEERVLVSIVDDEH